MKKVKDINGAEIRGLYKTETGALVVDDPNKYKVYQTRKEIALRESKEVEYLRSEIQSLRLMIEQMRNQKHG